MSRKQREYVPKDRRNARDAALCALLSVCENQKKSHYAIRETLLLCAEMKPEDRALAKRIAEGSLDYLIRIDYLLSRYLKLPLKLLKPVIRGILRISFYQLIYMDKVPESAVCNEAVELAKLHGLSGLSGLVNGVLRNAARDLAAKSPKMTEIPEEAAELSLPKWLFAKLIQDFGHEKTVQIAKAYLNERRLTVRFQLSKASEAEILSMLEAEGVECNKLDAGALLSKNGISLREDCIPVVYELSRTGNPAELQAFREGYIQPQDLSASLAAAMAEPEKGDYIIDVCAAPGGKSLQFADLLSGSGTVVARDLTPQKTALIEENLKRSGFKNVRTEVQDALSEDEESFYRADIVMADLPCSGLGIAARKPDIKYNIKPYSIGELKKLQQDILQVVSKYVKPHGKLIYSTCTLTKEEDEENVRYAESLGFTAEKMLKLFPDETKDGFFICVLTKKYQENLR